MSDPRFARLKSDPRFRRPRKKHAKVLIDDRFKAVFEQPKNKQSGIYIRQHFLTERSLILAGRVDKYGRPIADTHERDNLKRFYRLEERAPDNEPPTLTDYARGEVLLESSDDEDEGELSKSDNDNSIGLDSKRPIAIHGGALDEVNLDESEFADLDAQAAAYAEANPEPTQDGMSPSRRLAVVNLDWDHVRAVHLFKICSSLVSLTSSSSSASTSSRDKKEIVTKGSSAGIVRGKVLSIRVYPSEFGKERMAREEKEGPPPEIFKKTSDINEEVNAQNIYDVGGEDDYNKDALRQYQLERLRYYYAIITCDTVDASTHIYQELDGTELERSANVFDLSYVPDDMTFDDDFRDEATDCNSDTTFKSIDFVTDALRHSKVKLTWDEDDPERNQITRRKLTKKEIDDGDFKAFLASSSDSEAETVDMSSIKKKDRKASRNKMRALLLGGNDDLPEGWNHEDDPDDVDMEITFTPGLSEHKKDETTLDKYQRKMREKRKKRKEESKEKVQKVETGDNKDSDDFFDIGSDEEEINLPSSKDKRKREREQRPIRPLSTPEELALLVSSDNPTSETKHFDFKSVLKSEKRARRKGKKKRDDKDGNDNEAQVDFKIDVNDARFKALFEDHQYAIDPTNPHFKKTTSMDAFMQERSRRREVLVANPSATLQPSQSEVENKGLQSLVDSVKRKSALAHKPSKRRKV
ncbi:hypothetical protein H0H92_003123 [Tricholoma furcatifolium]|nr:hypothetical protein H0H92_003123 [Tricholoma furcatifolium]